MKIGLFGYGKMGRAIEKIAVERGLSIAWTITSENRASVTAQMLQEADVIIEFTRPESAYQNVMACLEAGVPVVCGTTGWQAGLTKAKGYCMMEQGSLLWASNFSVGVNVFFAVNRYLAKLMDTRPEYDASMVEIHHIHKLDAPSGTAITLAQEICEAVSRKDKWVLAEEATTAEAIPITAIREQEVPGTHVVKWQSKVDELEIKHTAHNREGFALGAVIAAQWLVGRKGFFNMQDVLSI